MLHTFGVQLLAGPHVHIAGRCAVRSPAIQTAAQMEQKTLFLQTLLG